MKTKAYLYIVVAAALWGLIGIFVKILAAQGFTPMQIVAIRAFTSALCITALLLQTDRHAFHIYWRDAWMFIGTGVVSLTFFNYCYFNCMEVSSLAVAALLLYTAPIFVMLMSLLLFGERFTKIKGIALGATFLGCAFITGTFDSDISLSVKGLLFGLGSGIGYALYSIFGKYAIRKYATPTITAYTFYCAALSSIPLADFAGSSGKWDGITLAAALGVAVLCTVIPYLLYTRGLQHVEAGQASIIATIEPLVAASVGVLCFDEPLTLNKIWGIVLIFTAVILLNLPQKARN